MRYFSIFSAAVVLLALIGCGSKPSGDDDFSRTLTVVLPQGQRITAELAITAADMLHGLMFRDSLAPDHGMLFVHPKPDKYQYWMYQTKIPLDIIWMSSSHRIVEISADTPPCHTKASACPQYGGHVDAQYVLELAGGMAAKYGLQVGDTLSF